MAVFAYYVSKNWIFCEVLLAFDVSLSHTGRNLAPIIY